MSLLKCKTHPQGMSFHTTLLFSWKTRWAQSMLLLRLLSGLPWPQKTFSATWLQDGGQILYLSSLKFITFTWLECVQTQVPSWLRSVSPIHQFLYQKMRLRISILQYLMPVKSASRPARPVRNSICCRFWGSAREPPAWNYKLCKLL